MIGKPIALIQVPNQRLFNAEEASRYLGIGRGLLAEMSDLGKIRCSRLRQRRMYRLEDLDAFIEGLPDYEPMAGSPIQMAGA